MKIGPPLSPSGLKRLVASDSIWNALALVLPGLVTNWPGYLLEVWRADSLDDSGRRELDSGIDTQECAGLSAGENALRGVLEGIISAACELGAAAVFLRRPTVRPIDAIGFGVAIGSFEVVFSLGVGFLEKLDDNLRFAGTPFDFVDGMFLFERFFAVIAHTAERLLIFVALCCRQWLPAGIAFITFSFVDGLAAHGLAANWNWENAAVNLRFQMTVAAVTLIEGSAATWFVRKSYSKLTRAPTRSAQKMRDPPAIDELR